ncbi:sensor histidine kinase [Streptosporangium sp. NPDC023615]|uniref:sensor histidine kinase n=1 Tax=Streptosporangium sp. NPDC023615 TaxID=3154794 RepID=UPI00341AA1CD
MGDVLLALGVWALYVLVTFMQGRFSAQGSSVLLFTSFTVSSAALLWRRSRPGLVVAVTALCDSVIVVSTGWKGYGLQVMLALYAAGRHGEARRAWIAAVAVALFYPAVATGVQLATAAGRQDSGSVGLLVPPLLVGAGRLVRLRREAALKREAERAEEIVRAERRHISRELHDVVAHNISTMHVLLGAARMTMADDPAGAETSLLSAERAGREALAEMRQLLSVLRADQVNDPAGAETSPAPARLPARGAAALPALVGRAREAEQPVSLEVTGELGRLPAVVDHAIYRIVQESLTNARKHAGNAPVRVRIVYEPSAVEVEVVDDGPGTPSGGRRHEGHARGGFGLGGMAERVALCGGRLETGPLPEGGFRIHARLPVTLSDTT